MLIATAGSFLIIVLCFVLAVRICFGVLGIVKAANSNVILLSKFIHRHLKGLGTTITNIVECRQFGICNILLNSRSPQAHAIFGLEVQSTIP